MAVFDDVLNAVIDMAETTNPYASIVIGSMPPDNGISVDGFSSPNETYMRKDMLQTMTLTLNGKHINQQTVANSLNAIHAALTRGTAYPNSTEYQIINIATGASPQLIGREENSQWLYGSSLNISFYWR